MENKLNLILNELQIMNNRITNLESNVATKDDISEIETRMATKDDIAEIETKMATKDDIAEIETKMATKDDVAEIETKMATKDDVAEIEARMATKDDIAEIEARLSNVETNMATKDDIADLPYIKQAVIENNQKLRQLVKTVSQISNTVIKIEHDHSEKLSSLFDGHQLHTEQLNRIEDKVSTHEEIIFKRIK